MLFANWLTATIIQWYDVEQKKASRSKARTGNVTINILDEIHLVTNKFKRSIIILKDNVIEYITEFIKKRYNNVTNLVLMKKEEEKTSSLDEGKNLNNEDNNSELDEEKEKENEKEQDKETKKKA